MPDLSALADAAHTNARLVVQELERQDLVMAEGHAILLAQQAQDLLEAITQARDAERVSEWADPHSTGS